MSLRNRRTCRVFHARYKFQLYQFEINTGILLAMYLRLIFRICYATLANGEKFTVSMIHNMENSRGNEPGVVACTCNPATLEANFGTVWVRYQLWG